MCFCVGKENIFLERLDRAAIADETLRLVESSFLHDTDQRDLYSL